MKDILRLRHRLALAFTSFPVGAAALVGCVDDVRYATSDVSASADGPAPGEEGDLETSCDARLQGELVVDYEDCGEVGGRWEMTVAQANALADPACSVSAQRGQEACPLTIELGELADRSGHRGEGLQLYLDVVDGDDLLCHYRWQYGFWECGDEGRALSDGEVHMAAPLRAGGGWSTAVAEVDSIAALPEAVRQLLGVGWLHSAQHEHASIASFARATQELMFHRAPRQLLAAAHMAALDEIRHANGCFTLAGLYLGMELEPDRLQTPPARYGTLAELAVETFAEGVVGETVATLRNTRALATCEVDEVRPVLQAIVDEEAEHAALAWATIAWAIGEGGPTVADAVRAAADALRPGEPVSLPEVSEALAATLRRHGRLDPASAHRAEVDAWRGVIDPNLDELLASLA